MKLNLSKFGIWYIKASAKVKEYFGILLIKEKAKFFPADIKTNSIKSCITLQNLMDHTVSKLIESNKKAITSYENKQKNAAEDIS